MNLTKYNLFCDFPNGWECLSSPAPRVQALRVAQASRYGQHFMKRHARGLGCLGPWRFPEKNGDTPIAGWFIDVYFMKNPIYKLIFFRATPMDWKLPNSHLGWNPAFSDSHQAKQVEKGTHQGASKGPQVWYCTSRAWRHIYFFKWTLETVLTLFSCEIPVISKQGKDMKGIENEDPIKISNMFQ